MKNYNINDSEWKILKALWQKPNSTLRDIYSNLSDNNWSYTTVRTLITRLIDKGLIVADTTVANNFKYSANVKAEDCKKKEAKKFISKVFDGSVSMFISALAKESSLSKEEQEQLLNIIDKMEEGE